MDTLQSDVSVLQGDFKKPQCMTKKDTYTFDYPPILKLEKMQLDNFWQFGEPQVEKDKHQILTEMDAEDKHGIITTLKLFTLYELKIGHEYWNGRFKRMFPRPEFERLAAANGFMELSVHAPFYNEINVVLGLATDEFYSSYLDDPVLKDRMDFIDEIIARKGNVFDDLISLAVFSLVEGAVLYSSFAYLKSFQANGKNKIGSVVSGIDFSVRDEHAHALSGAASFQIAIQEMREDGTLTDERFAALSNVIRNYAMKVKEHEFAIIDKIFEKGDKDNQKLSMQQFVLSRINLCLQNLGIHTIYSYDEIGENKVASWFYKNISMPVIGDFFVNLQSNYSRDWNQQAFVVEPNKYTFEE